MNQVGRTFVPHVLPVAVGTRVHFPNYDQIHHHVYSFSRTKTFELPLYRGEEAPPVLFDKPGVVKLGCNIHDWMAGIVLVLPYRHFAMTDAEGRYSTATCRPATIRWSPGTNGAAKRRTPWRGRSRPCPRARSSISVCHSPTARAARAARRPVRPMSWWARSRLRTRIFLAFSALVLAALAATLGFTQLVVGRDAERKLRDELVTTGEVSTRLLRERATRLQTNSALLASDLR